ncbi:hypothetical protein ACFY8C_31415 [Streptomyces flavochromogenes]|uniref:Uncharacterized protein n=1 Tax=Streptomyces flavochromogenes TaxID=68199 RepID=A0ABW6XZ67_9ACTN|nr:hypothetical protein [Streptomyces flavochromogenes]
MLCSRVAELLAWTVQVWGDEHALVGAGGADGDAAAVTGDGDRAARAGLVEVGACGQGGGLGVGDDALAGDGAGGIDGLGGRAGRFGGDAVGAFVGAGDSEGGDGEQAAQEEKRDGDDGDERGDRAPVVAPVPPSCGGLELIRVPGRRRRWR